MTMDRKDVKKIADLLHTIYCGGPHELKMELFHETKKCKYYLEESMDRTWEFEDHREWLSQAHCLISVSEPLDALEVLGDIIRVYQIAERLKNINPKLFKYILMLIR